MRVNAALGQLLDQPLGLIEGEKLSDTHTDEGGLFLMDVRKRKGDTQRMSEEEQHRNRFSNVLLL